MRGWPVARIAFYGPNLSQATKVLCLNRTVREGGGSADTQPEVDHGDIRGDAGVARVILEFIEKHRVLAVAVTDGIIGCAHQQGINYEGEWCPAC
jgi:hypothetical protein